jgi:hypothetical protein
MLLRWFIFFTAFLYWIECKIIEDSALGLNEVAYHNEPSMIFLGAPSIVRLSSGRLVACYEHFTMPAYAQIPNVTVYISDDNGQSWSFSSNITHTFFTTLTVYNNMIYAIGIDNDSNGGTVIHRSSDNGATWNYNGSDKGVILFREKFAGGVTPIVIANQVMYHGTEYWPSPSRYPQDYQAAIMSCDLSKFTGTEEDDPLMNPKNWRITPPLPFDQKWIPKSYPHLYAPGFLEGNVVIVPKPSSKELRVLNIIRFQSEPLPNLAIVLELNQTTNTLSFVSIINFPGGLTKFVIRYDPVTNAYYSFVNPGTSQYPDQRNILSLSYTKDLINLSDWKILADRLLYDDTGLAVADSVRYTGFHYVDWQFDRLSSFQNQSSCIEWNCDGGPDLVYLIRTGYRGANSFHNTNRITYKNLTNYRQLLKEHERMTQKN